MKKKDFVTLIMSIIGGILFALGMCMALVPEWGAMTPGIVSGIIGIIVLLAMGMIRRKMDGKPAVEFNGKVIATTLYGIFATVIFGAGMCMTMVWNMMLPGIIVGLSGIVLLLGLIPICKGLK